MNTPIDKEHARNALEFISRATLKGSEVNAFSAVCNWLLNIANMPIELATARNTILAQEEAGE